MTLPDPMAEFAAALAPADAQHRAAARDLLDGDRASSDARRAEAARIFRREVSRVVEGLLVRAWEKALANERAARSGKGA